MVQGRAGGTGDPPVSRKRDTPGLEPHRGSGNTEPKFAFGRVREMAASSLRKLKEPQNPAYGFHRNEGRVAKRPSGLRLFSLADKRLRPALRYHGTGYPLRKFS